MRTSAAVALVGILLLTAFTAEVRGEETDLPDDVVITEPPPAGNPPLVEREGGEIQIGIPEDWGQPEGDVFVEPPEPTPQPVPKE